ncbi:MDR family MFS transporter [Clostridioides sp. ES-S-0048-02]|uniref:MDR family MFS transporter n=1 Tax=Clostridioides sp. ES-S-0048-02 TaxID=2770777 RepID=UPI001D0F554D|nr:multidrug efflux MFS transporter [Clostridioides sp. ES-S-0048-02]
MSLNKQSRNMIFAVLLIGSIVGSLLQTSLTTALPVMMGDLNISATTAQWLTSAYTLAMGIMVPATAFLIRRFPTKPLFISAMSLFAVGLLLSASASSFTPLLFGRILQAMGNGVLLSMTQVIILTIYPAEQMGSIMGIYGLAAGAAPIFAPTLAGIVIDIFNWQAIFWFSLVISIIDIIIASRVLQNVIETKKQSFDTFSMILCAVGFSGLLLGLGNIGTTEFFSINIALPLFVGIVSIIVFSLRQIHSKEPFLELRILKNKSYRLAVIISMLLYVVMMAGSTLIPIYIQTIRGFSATKCGLIMMPGSLVMALISPFAGRFYDRFGIRKLVVCGSIFLAISCLGVSFVGEDTSVLYISAFYIIRLIAIGLIMMPIVTWGMSVLGEKNIAHGTALLTSLRTIAGAIGSAVFVAVMTTATVTSRGMTNATANVFGMDVAFICISIVAVVQLLVAFFFIERKSLKKSTN